MTPTPLAEEMRAAVETGSLDLARAALVIARIEYPRLDPAPVLARLDELGRRATDRLAPLDTAPVRVRLAELNRLLFDEERFTGNREHYFDFRNSLLNVVLERRLGIPITLALVYIEVARRAGVEVFGVSFPGHFLMRVPDDAGRDGDPIVLDPFDGGRELDSDQCRSLLGRFSASATFDPSLLEPCTSRQLLVRMLNNLKRTYVEMRSYPHARAATELLLALEPSSDIERRDRGLIAYQLDDIATALGDLEAYLRFEHADEADRVDRDRLRQYLRRLRETAAGLN